MTEVHDSREPKRPEISIRCPAPELASEYFENLRSSGYLSPFKGYGVEGRHMQLSFPIQLPLDVAQDLVEGLRLTQDYIRERFDSPDKLHDHLVSTAPQIGGQSIVSEAVSKRIFDLYSEHGLSLPAAVDVMLTKRGFKVVEDQTACGYIGEYMAEFDAAHTAGFRIPEADRYLGTRHPYEALPIFKERLSPDSPMYVLDADSLTDGGVGDRLRLAKLLGKEDTYPIDLKKIDRDETGKLYFPEERLVDGVVFETGERIYPEAIFSRATPAEVKALEAFFAEKGQPEKIGMVAELYRDGSIQWGLHPAVYSIVDKGNLEDLAAYAHERGHPFAPYFPEMHSEGSALPNGRWALKIRDGNSGQGLALIEVGTAGEYEVASGAVFTSRTGDVYRAGSNPPPGSYGVSYPVAGSVPPEDKVHRVELCDPSEPYTVPSGYMAQEKFDFQPVQIQVPKTISPEGYVEGTLEVRSFRHPCDEKELCVMFGYRAAPRVNTKGEIVLTNLGPAMRAFDELAERAGLSGKDLEDARNQSMFGMGAASVPR